MAGISEKYLGKRIVNYLKNEALVGRINQQKIQVKLSTVLYCTVLYCTVLYASWQNKSTKNTG